MSRTVEEYLSMYSPEVREIALRARELVLQVWPEACEQVTKSNPITYGMGQKRSEGLFYISAHKAHANLGFFYAVGVPDPEGLLEGTGKHLRHVKLRRPEDVDRTGVRALLEASLAQH